MHHGDRERLRDTFDQAAELYQRARPDYPAELLDELVAVTGIKGADRLLEVGCASGKATFPLARRGFHITCLEPGLHLAAAARRNLREFDCEVIQQRFEDWKPRKDQSFDLLYAATAWHWIDPEVRYVKAWQVLRPGAHLAFWEAVHVFPEGGDPFFVEIQDVYEEIGEGLPEGAAWPRPGELEEEIIESGLFEVVRVKRFDWEAVYDAKKYIELLSTLSGHIAMHAWQRDRLFGEIRKRLALRPDGLLRRHWGAVLHIARRLERV